VERFKAPVVQFKGGWSVPVDNCFEVGSPVLKLGAMGKKWPPHPYN
jgi:hypothetical protein